MQLADRIINSAPATARRSRPVSSPSSAVQRPPSKTHVPRIEPSTLQREVDAFLQLPAGTEQEQQEEKQQQTAHAELPFNAGASVAFCIPAAANRVLRLLAQCHQAPAFRHLTVLKLSGCSGLTDEAAIPVLAAFSAVTDLDLSGCTAITKRTLSAITTYLPRVQILELAGLQQFVDDDFAEYVLFNSFNSLGCLMFRLSLHWCSFTFAVSFEDFLSIRHLQVKMTPIVRYVSIHFVVNVLFD